jgi:hypothetical protein
VYISRPERSWIRPWHFCRRRHQRSFWEEIYVHPEEGMLHALRARTTSPPNTCQTTRATWRSTIGRKLCVIWRRHLKSKAVKYDA